MKQQIHSNYYFIQSEGISNGERMSSIEQEDSVGTNLDGFLDPMS